MARMADVPAIETFGLSKTYRGAVEALVGLDLRVGPGEVFGFLGPNGAGKSTTIRLLLDLIRPTAGRASLLGRDSRTDGAQVRRRVGYLPGDLRLYDRLTGREQLDSLERLRGAGDAPFRAELVERFQVSLDRPIRELSKGNRQKLGVVQAFMHRPELVILDEPTSGLDPLMQEEFLALVREESERGCAVFISSHELDEIERVCDRVGVIREGRLIAVERVAELLGKTPRRASVCFADRVDPAELRAIPGVTDLAVEDGRVTFHVSGEIDAVVKALSRHTVAELKIAHPTLEEVFLSYYEGER
jgi:beta-exotoxin I transport system ATP-binding protein